LSFTTTQVAAELAAEIARGGWMYEFQLTPAVNTPAIGPNLRSIHETRKEMIEPVVRDVLEAAGPDASALDLACNEGWFSHHLLEWGARRVVGIDIRSSNIHRAKLIRDHFQIPHDQLVLEQGDVLELDPSSLGQFDVVLALGLIYHLERPLQALRVARALTRRACVIESQLTRQDRPIVRGDGVPGEYHQTPESFAAWVEDDPQNPRASAADVMSLVPNRAALEALPRWAGFDNVQWLAPQAHHDVQYVAGDRGVVAARVGDRVSSRPGAPS
jgi:tRNA (mo5U34)-methyltransferase